MDLILAITLVSLAVCATAALGLIVQAPAASGARLTVADIQARLAAEQPAAPSPLSRRR